MRTFAVVFTLLVVGVPSYLFATNQHTDVLNYVEENILPMEKTAKDAEPSGAKSPAVDKEVQPKPPEAGKPIQPTTSPNGGPKAMPVHGSKVLVAPASKLNDVDLLVNKNVHLPSDYVPKDLVKPNIPFSFSADSPKKYMRKEAAAAIERLFAQAKKDKIELAGVSAYRSYATQKAIFDRNAKAEGAVKANQTSAIPGQSEHQTGLAIDISTKRMNYLLSEDFAKTPEGQWLAKNAPNYGFIIRYPKGKESITGYSFEPWHLRYVGVDAAKEITAKGITLEEYLLGITG